MCLEFCIGSSSSICPKSGQSALGGICNAATSPCLGMEILTDHTHRHANPLLSLMFLSFTCHLELFCTCSHFIHSLSLMYTNTHTHTHTHTHTQTHTHI